MENIHLIQNNVITRNIENAENSNGRSKSFMSVRRNYMPTLEYTPEQKAVMPSIASEKI